MVYCESKGRWSLKASLQHDIDPVLHCANATQRRWNRAGVYLSVALRWVALTQDIHNMTLAMLHNAMLDKRRIVNRP